MTNICSFNHLKEAMMIGYQKKLLRGSSFYVFMDLMMLVQTKKQTDFFSVSASHQVNVGHVRDGAEPCQTFGFRSLWK